MRSRDPEADERLYARAVAIREGEALGLWVPIMHRLARRGHTEAAIELAAHLAEVNGVGRLADRWSAAALYRRALLAGNGRAAQHLAVDRFNRDDLRGYRRWLQVASRAGDDEARTELRWFEERKTHGLARLIRRGRPVMKRDGYGYWRGRWRYPRNGPRPS